MLGGADWERDLTIAIRNKPFLWRTDLLPVPERADSPVSSLRNLPTEQTEPKSRLSSPAGMPVSRGIDFPVGANDVVAVGGGGASSRAVDGGVPPPLKPMA